MKQSQNDEQPATRKFARFAAGLLVALGIVSIAGCASGDPVIAASSSPVNSARTSATPDATSSAGGDATGEPSVYESEVASYTEWSEGDELAPGMYVVDPDGVKGEKPESLRGHSAYLMDGAWYLFDAGAKELPQYVQDVYLLDESPRPDESTSSYIGRALAEMLPNSELDPRALGINVDLEMCSIGVTRNGKGQFLSFGQAWVADGGNVTDTQVLIDNPNPNAGPTDAYWHTYEDPRDAYDAMQALMLQQGVHCKNLPENWSWQNVGWG